MLKTQLKSRIDEKRICVEDNGKCVYDINVETTRLKVLAVFIGHFITFYLFLSTSDPFFRWKNDDKSVYAFGSRENFFFPLNEYSPTMGRVYLCNEYHTYQTKQVFN